MLLTFVATSGQTEASEAPALPDLYIRDTESGLNIPVAGVFGWDNDFLQTQTITTAPLVFTDVEEDIVSGSESQEYWCRRLSKFILNLSFSDSGASANVRIIRKDKNDIICYGELKTITALTHQINSKYASEICIFDSYGANKMSILIESISSGTVDIRLAGV